MPTKMTVVQQFDAPPAKIFSMFGDRDFITGRLGYVGGIDPTIVTQDTADSTLTLVTRQGIPKDVMPAMVASMMPGDPTIERTENWHADGDGYAGDFGVTVKGAPASLKGAMTLTQDGLGSKLTTTADALVPIPLFGGKIEEIIVEQITNLLNSEGDYTRTVLAG